MRKLTRYEMWKAITSKFKTLRTFSIDCKFNQWSNYIKRKDLFNILIEMKLHKSRHLTKQQKIKVNYELNIDIVDKI